MNKELTPLEVWKGIQWALKDVGYGAKETIEKALKALEIIKLKQVNVYSFIQRNPKTFEEYQDIDDEIEQLSEVSLSMEEFDLLKEVLK